MLAINEILQERYRIIRQLGQGGMGAIYVAEDVKRFGKPVALKEILIDHAKLLDQKKQDLFRRAFEREAKILTQLEHESFPQVVDYFLETNRQFLVMELVQGEDLGELLGKDQRPFPLADVLKWTEQLLEALDYLHTLSPPVIHRDIKPQNLKVNSRGKIKLLDFGIATGANTPVQATFTNQTFVAASLHYSPAEQIIKVIDADYRELLEQKFGAPLSELIAAKSDASSDIYALGATIYHLLTARLPVDALKRRRETWEGKADPLIPPHKANSQIPYKISDWILKAMAIEREDRFVSADEMHRALGKAIFQSDESVRHAEHEQLKQEREAIRQERQKFEAERLSHWRQIEAEQKRQATEREAQNQFDRQDDWMAQNQEIAQIQSSFPLHTINEPSPTVSGSSKNSEVGITVDESKPQDTVSHLTESSYLPKNFHTNKIQKTVPEIETIREGNPSIRFAPKRKGAWILPAVAVGLLLFAGTVLGIWLLSSGKTGNIGKSINTNADAAPTTTPSQAESNQIIINSTPNTVATPPLKSVNQTGSRPTPQSSRPQPTKTAMQSTKTVKSKSVVQDPNCVFTNSCK